jgi:N-glycosidase YbiA
MTTVTGERVITEFAGAWRFLSNFSPSPLTMPDGVTYPTAEHAFQAQKTLIPAMRDHIAALPTPAEAKRAGRTADLRPDWERIKKQMMLRIVMAKFGRNPERARALCGTTRPEDCPVLWWLRCCRDGVKQ